MKTPSEATLAEAVLVLRELPRKRNSVRQARVRFETFKARHPGLRCDLLVDHPPGSDEADYDILLGSENGSTVVVSWRPDDGSPWTVRYSDHWAANFVLSVNDRDLSIQSALIYLSTVLRRTPSLIDDLINRSLILESIEEKCPPVSEAELKKAVNDFRIGQGLHSAAATQRWLDEMGLTMDSLRDLVLNSVQVRKLKRQLTEELVRAYFMAHHHQFDSLTIFRLQVPSRPVALRLSRMTRKSDLRSLLDRDIPELRIVRGEFETRFSCDLPPELAAAPVGIVIGPHPSPDGFWLAQVLKRKSARLDSGSRARIHEILFAEWLAERRAKAKVRWHWM